MGFGPPPPLKEITHLRLPAEQVHKIKGQTRCQAPGSISVSAAWISQQRQHQVSFAEVQPFIPIHFSRGLLGFPFSDMPWEPIMFWLLQHRGNHTFSVTAGSTDKRDAPLAAVPIIAGVIIAAPGQETPKAKASLEAVAASYC